MARGQKAAPRSTWSEERRKNADQYNKKHYSVVGAKLPREAADRFRSYCAEHGTTVSALLSSYIYSLIGRPGEDQETGEAPRRSRRPGDDRRPDRPARR